MTDEQIIAFGRAHDCVDDLCVFVDYDPDVGAIPVTVKVKAGVRELLRSALAEAPEEPASIDMVLHCPACGMQHVSRPVDRPVRP